MKRFPTDDTICNLFRKFGMGEVQRFFEPMTEWQMQRLPLRPEGYTLDMDSKETIADRYDIRWNTMLDSLTEIPGKAILMVDTCHAGAAGGTRSRGLRPVNFDSVLADLKGISGVVVYAASTGSESSLEKSEWRHGAFTKAVLDALSGGVAGKDGIIRTSDLDTWVKEQVSALTSNQQHALAYYLPPDELLPFPIFSIKGPAGSVGTSQR